MTATASKPTLPALLRNPQVVAFTATLPEPDRQRLDALRAEAVNAWQTATAIEADLAHAASVLSGTATDDDDLLDLLRTERASRRLPDDLATATFRAADALERYAAAVAAAAQAAQNAATDALNSASQERQRLWKILEPANAGPWMRGADYQQARAEAEARWRELDEQLAPHAAAAKSAEAAFWAARGALGEANARTLAQLARRRAQRALEGRP